MLALFTCGHNSDQGAAGLHSYLYAIERDKANGGGGPTVSGYQRSSVQQHVILCFSRNATTAVWHVMVKVECAYAEQIHIV